MKKLFLLIICFLSFRLSAQELQARITVLSPKVNSTVDKKVFNTLQNQLINLINNRKWTKDGFNSNERIECQFLLNIEEIAGSDIYRASLTVQAARPVYNSDYNAATVNFRDADILFKYIEYQPVEFNENRVAGSDPLASNLTAVIAFYINIILGMDYDSFFPKSGDFYFQRAMNIVNNSPEAKDISGWRAFDGLRNRYWLAENFTNTKYNLFHDIIYAYYRQGLDQFYKDENLARKNILDAMVRLQAFNQANPNTMIVQFFMQSKAPELIGMFKKAAPADRKKFLDIVTSIDIANIDKYNQELK